MFSNLLSSAYICTRKIKSLNFYKCLQGFSLHRIVNTFQSGAADCSSKCFHLSSPASSQSSSLVDGNKGSDAVTFDPRPLPQAAILTCCRSTPPCATENRGWEPKSEASNTFSRHRETQAKSTPRLELRTDQTWTTWSLQSGSGSFIATAVRRTAKPVWGMQRGHCYTLTNVKLGQISPRN